MHLHANCNHNHSVNYSYSCNRNYSTNRNYSRNPICKNSHRHNRQQQR